MTIILIDPNLGEFPSNRGWFCFGIDLGSVIYECCKEERSYDYLIPYL
ncbi:MAG: hypothetical protein NZO16_02860 [Deltaproteobacteria bacterium]|nr:hypothetical protein [Deltaproteobacteria bacterium]